MKCNMLWSDEDKGDFMTCAKQCFLKVSGNVDGNRQFSSIRTLDKLPTDNISYFEIGIVNAGNSNGIGISPKTTDTNRPPRLDLDTIGYQGDE